MVIRNCYNCSTACMKHRIYGSNYCISENQNFWCHKLHGYGYLLGVMGGINVVFFIISRFCKHKTSICTFVANIFINITWSTFILGTQCTAFSFGVPLCFVAPMFLMIIFVIWPLSTTMEPCYDTCETCGELSLPRKNLDELQPFIQEIRELPPIFELKGEAYHRTSKNGTKVTYEEDMIVPYESWEDQSLNILIPNDSLVIYRPSFEIIPDPDLEAIINEYKDNLKTSLTNKDSRERVKENYHLTSDVQSANYTSNDSKIICCTSWPMKFLYYLSVLLGFSHIYDLIWINSTSKIEDKIRKVASSVSGKYRCLCEERDIKGENKDNPNGDNHPNSAIDQNLVENNN